MSQDNTPHGDALGFTPREAERLAHVAAIQAELDYPRETPWAWVGSQGLIAPAVSSVPVRLVGHHPMLVTSSAADTSPVESAIVDVWWDLTSNNAAPELAARWPGYRFELFGFLLYINQHQLQYEAPNPPTTGACWRMYSPANGQTWLAVHIWLQRAYYGEDPAAYAEVTWRPGRPTTRGGVQYHRGRRVSATDETRARDGLVLLEYLTPNEKRAAARRALLEGARGWGGHPDKLLVRHIAEHLILSVRRVEDLMKEADWHRNDLRTAYKADRAKLI